jgi:hypothetical protein
MYKLAGRAEFLDDVKNTGVNAANRGTYLFGHKVTPVSGVPGQVTIPVVWPEGKFPSFGFTNQAAWTRHNKLDTLEEIKAAEPTTGGGLKVCWGPKDGTSVKYFAEVGRLKFTEPPLMEEAFVSPTTTQLGATAPIIISFKTGGQMLEKPKSEVGKLFLRIQFVDVGKIVPRIMGDTPPSGTKPAELGATAEMLLRNAQQAECGRLFTELWSRHDQGFPVPEACGYSRKQTENTASGTRTWREYYIVFGERNGLRHGTEYQMALLATPTSMTRNETLVELYTGGTCNSRWDCSRPYHVFEKGVARALHALQAAGGENDPTFDDRAGFDIQLVSPDDGVLDLSTATVFQVKMTALSLQRAITKNSYFPSNGTCSSCACPPPWTPSPTRFPIRSGSQI